MLSLGNHVQVVASQLWTTMTRHWQICSAEAVVDCPSEEAKAVYEACGSHPAHSTAHYEASMNRQDKLTIRPIPRCKRPKMHKHSASITIARGPSIEESRQPFRQAKLGR